MENIKLIEPINIRNCVEQSEAQDSVSQNHMLTYVLKLQNQLCIEGLLSAYIECIKSILDVDGIRYRYPLLGITHQIGKNNIPQCQIHLETYNEFMGDVTLYHHTEINKSTLKTIELITTLLTQPLRAFILQTANNLLSGNQETVGVANVPLVEQLVIREAKLAHRERVPMSLLLLNIDRFHKIVQNFGFTLGDEILYQVMQVMRSNVRETDLLFRYENDTYCLILKGVNTENALLISERIRHAVDSHQFNIDSDKLSNITISSGIAKLVSTDSIESILSRATKAVQHAKKMGRNQSIIADGKFIT